MAYDFVQNRQCEYFPCHQGLPADSFSCLFCYCPLYALGENCGGSFRYTADGIKDCSNCLRPHRRENYAAICEKMKDIIEMAKKQPDKK
ncbi:MAG: cysteine-rich small domain-containing protein [Oscillospiraceae bacterium]|nr:cysteine-rich small domain-containing protein [Oscillospiraceae bacterium]